MRPHGINKYYMCQGLNSLCYRDGHLTFNRNSYKGYIKLLQTLGLMSLSPITSGQRLTPNDFGKRPSDLKVSFHDLSQFFFLGGMKTQGAYVVAWW